MSVISCFDVPSVPYFLISPFILREPEWDQYTYPCVTPFLVSIIFEFSLFFLHQ